MASEDGRPARALALLKALESEPHRFDLFQALRRLECAHPDRPRLGEAGAPAEEPVRVGQEPSVAFPDRTIASLEQGDGPPRLSTFTFGVFGPNGPLPLHLTEYARDRMLNAQDPTLARFLDIFHHRMATLFYRAFADAEPTISLDRPAADRFAVFIGSLFGTGSPSTRNRGLLPDRTKLHYAGLLAAQARNADGLAALVGDLFRVAARVEQFVGEWVDVPEGERSRLGGKNCSLGVDVLLGARTWLCAGRFRLVLGPLRRAQFDRFLPGAPDLVSLAEVVRTYAGDELTWDLELALARPDWRSLALGASRLGWDSWVGARPDTWRAAALLLTAASRVRPTTACDPDVLTPPPNPVREPVHV
jgi:type VI secretion system protein ImpH